MPQCPLEGAMVGFGGSCILLLVLNNTVQLAVNNQLGVNLNQVSDASLMYLHLERVGS